MHHTLGWNQFTTKLPTWFQPSEFEDFTSALIKLHQIGIGKYYLMPFEKFPKYTTKLPNNFFKSSFINDLQEDIKLEVKLWQLDESTKPSQPHWRKLQCPTWNHPYTGLP